MVKSDGYYIGTEEQCNAYDSTVTTSENYQGTTKRWAEPRKHPVEDKWAIIKHIKYTDETMESAVELDASWNSTTNIHEAEILNDRIHSNDTNFGIENE